VARNNPFLPYIQGEQEARGFELEITPDAESTSQMFDRLESGEADLTLIESHLATAELAYRDSTNIVVVTEADTVPGRSWSVRHDQPQLLAALDDFIGRQRGSLTYNVLLRKYFQPDSRIVEQPDLREDGSLSPFDELVQTHAEATEFDWRMLTAQMFVESRFDPQARSHVGAYGLLQMMPATAQQVGVSDLDDPAEQIRGGVAYLAWLFNRFPDELEFGDRRAFTLAAYNAGYGHVADARHVAKEMGLDPDRWFDNVEVAMLSLSDPDVYRNTTHGYVRGHEPVQYVRRIAELGQMYARLKPTG
jgi:membrane-bound lytic murein transglycosylase F